MVEAWMAGPWMAEAWMAGPSMAEAWMAGPSRPPETLAPLVPLAPMALSLSLALAIVNAIIGGVIVRVFVVDIVCDVHVHDVDKIRFEFQQTRDVDRFELHKLSNMRGISPLLFLVKICT
jgi:hypothetical protein